MLVLNNAHSKHDITFKWKPKQDYSVNGSIIYPRGTLQRFKGRIIDEQSLINKVFHEGLDRDNRTMVIETVAQYPFLKDELIYQEDTEFIITQTRKIQDENQFRFLKSAYVSLKWYLVVEGDE